MEGRAFFRQAPLQGALAPLLTAAGSAAAQAARYPLSSVTLITHSSPGGGSDVFLREMTRYLQPLLGTNFAVENLRGGSGAQAAAVQ